jgi:hypothetical protein
MAGAATSRSGPEGPGAGACRRLVWPAVTGAVDDRRHRHQWQDLGRAVAGGRIYRSGPQDGNHRHAGQRFSGRRGRSSTSHTTPDAVSACNGCWPTSGMTAPPAWRWKCLLARSRPGPGRGRGLRCRGIHQPVPRSPRLPRRHAATAPPNPKLFQWPGLRCGGAQRRRRTGCHPAWQTARRRLTRVLGYGLKCRGTARGDVCQARPSMGCIWKSPRPGGAANSTRPCWASSTPTTCSPPGRPAGSADVPLAELALAALSADAPGRRPHAARGRAGTHGAHGHHRLRAYPGRAGKGADWHSSS